MTTTETRRYRIMGLLGRGGYGAVYRARMEGPEGFTKDVAVKIITSKERSSQQTLARFRDEARILGLVRDRAVVGVDPPTFLDGRLALVMEYVDGQSLSQVLEAHRTVPAAVALEIVGEVARSLDRVFHQRGPDGDELQLVHRDLKPANLQLTPGGEVRILDFGIATARFAARESVTTETVAGTAAYMAPERLAGLGGQPADIYALGVVLHELVVGVKPSPRDRYTPTGIDEARDAALLLADQMRELHEEERPTAREVARRCRALRADFPEPDLRDWAEAHVSVDALEQTDSEGFVGRVLSESHTLTVSDTSPLPRRVGLRMVLAALFGGGGVAAVLGTVVVVLVVVALLVWLGSSAPVAEGPPIAEPTPPGAARVEPELEPEAPLDGGDDPVPAASETEPTIDVPEPEPEPEAAPAPAMPVPVDEPEPPDEDTTIAVTITSVPFGLEVFIDGASVGTTPRVDEALPPGEHEVRIEAADGRSIERAIRVGARAPVRYVWKVEQDSWESGF